MWSRWDMQDAPPDILITNFSMLSIMLMRDADAPIFRRTREWLTRDKPAANTGKLRIVRRRAARSFLLGTSVHDLAKLLQPLRPHLTIQISNASHAAVLPFVLDNLSCERLVIAGIESPKHRLDHWVLAVGVAGIQERDQLLAQRLLFLDSNHDPIPMLPWNATLAVSAHRPGGRARLWATSDGKVIPVTLHHALAVGRRKSDRSR